MMEIEACWLVRLPGADYHWGDVRLFHVTCGQGEDGEADVIVGSRGFDLFSSVEYLAECAVSASLATLAYLAECAV